MNFAALSDEAILQTLGDRLKQERLNRNLTQEHLARASGISATVVKRAERGYGCTLRNLVRILRSIGRLETLDSFLPEHGPSPIALADMAGRRRREASGGRGRRSKKET